jgi:transcriptional regulator with XRE-family HTH domain
MKYFGKTLGRRIRALRRSMNLTQENLAEKTGLSYKFIGEIERGSGNPTILTIAKISNALEVPLVRLFADEKTEEESFYGLSREDLLTLKKAAEILGKVIGR